MRLSLRIYSQRGSVAARRAGSSTPSPEFQADDPPERHPSRRCRRRGALVATLLGAHRGDFYKTGV